VKTGIDIGRNGRENRAYSCDERIISRSSIIEEIFSRGKCTNVHTPIDRQKRKICRDPHPAQTAMKPREPRRTVLIQARMRTGAFWSDIVIHNVSSRGLMVQTEQPPEPGTYVEIRRGAQVIIGRSVWRTVRNFGVLTQDRIDIEAVIKGPELPAAQRPTTLQPERRADPQRQMSDVAYRAARSRQTSALLQYIVIGVVSIVAAGFAASEVYALLTRPLTTISSHLSDGS
jgi:hypothetical protein